MRRVNARTPAITLLVVALAACLMTLVHDHRAAVVVQPQPAASEQVPIAAQAAISRALGRDDRSYHVTTSGGTLRATNARNGLSATFTTHAVTLRSGTAWMRLGLRTLGYPGALRPITAVHPRAVANRVSYPRAAVTQWWANGPQGLEQGFTIKSRPAGLGSGVLTLGLSLSSNQAVTLRPDRLGLVVGHSGTLSYRGLTATDADGRSLRTWLQLRSGDLQIRVDASGAHYPLTIDPIVQQAKLTASDGGAFDFLGVSVAVSGDTLVTSGGSSGVAYIFVKPKTGWANATQTAKLTTTDGATNGAVAISGDTIVSGPIGGVNPQGSVYVFVKPKTGWTSATQTATLTSAGGVAGDFFGSPAVSGSTIAVGATGVAGGRGAVYVFTKPKVGWSDATQTATLTASDAVAGDGLGFAVAVAGRTVAATSSPSATPGVVYEFTQPPRGWADATQTAKLTASEDSIGVSVSVSGAGDTIVSGARFATVGPNGAQGAAYVFVKPAAGWTTATQTGKLTASDGAAGDLLGSSVAVSDDTIVAGAPLASVGANSGQGALYLFSRPKRGWANATQTAKLAAPDGITDDTLGQSVAVSSDAIVAGDFSPALGDNAIQGAAHVFGCGGERDKAGAVQQSGGQALARCAGPQRKLG